MVVYTSEKGAIRILCGIKTKFKSKENLFRVQMDNAILRSRDYQQLSPPSRADTPWRKQ